MDVNAEAGLFSITTQRGMTGNRVAVMNSRIRRVSVRGNVVVAATFQRTRIIYTGRSFKQSPFHARSFLILSSYPSITKGITFLRPIIPSNRRWISTGFGDSCSVDVDWTCRTVKGCVLTFFGSLCAEGHSFEKSYTQCVTFESRRAPSCPATDQIVADFFRKKKSF